MYPFEFLDHSSTITSLFVNPSENNPNISNETIEQRNLQYNQPDDALPGSGTNSENINKPTVTAMITIVILLFFNLPTLK